MKNFHKNQLAIFLGNCAIMPLISLLLMQPVLAANTQATKSDIDLNPLRPADTSSPRGTLHSFLSATNLIAEDFLEDKEISTTYLALRRASQTLDFSTTPEGDSWSVRIRRIVLLHELLARVELPPDDRIPGGREAADGSVTKWTIPNTNITIEKISVGPRAGQFVFSAHTVQRLDRLYRQSKHLPSKRDIPIGIFENLLSGGSKLYTQTQQMRNRLKPVDTSSPRSTLEGFLDSVNRAYELVIKAKSGLQADPPITIDEAREIEATASYFLQRASDTFDFSQVPEALRQDVSIETVLRLKEILDRMNLPPIDSMPNVHMVTAAKKAAADVQAQNTEPFRWRLPNSQIEIVETVSGKRQGQFLFSASTVQRIADDYKKIKDLAYRQAKYGGLELEYLSPGLSPGFYEDYISTPGYLIPETRLLGRIIDQLPDGFTVVYAGQRVWQWIGLFLSVSFIAIFSYGVFFYITRLGKKLRSPWLDWLNVLVPIIILFIVIVVGNYIDDSLNFTGDLQSVLKSVIAIIKFLLVAWAVFVFGKAVAESVIATPRMHDKGSEAALLRIGVRVIGLLVAAWIVIDGIRALGADLFPLLAGLGVGGIAVALAAKTTMENFLGGLILFANKPVRVGDFCRYGVDPSPGWLRIGTVEEIGLISTRIRGIDRTVTTIPNAEFSNMHIVNFSQRDKRLLRTTLHLRYETTPEQLRYILIKVRELLIGHPMVYPDPARVRFVSYSDYSKDIEIFCYLLCKEQNEFLAIQEDVLLHIDDIVKEAGSGFALPSQTAYLSRDSVLDEKLKEKAETEVGHRRFIGKLPFPEFDEEEREQLEDLLDYPPKGSANYKTRQDKSKGKLDKS